MADFWESLENAIRGSFCSILNTGYDAYRFTRNTFGGVDLGGGALMGALKGRYCNNPAPPPPVPPPFTGGQCCDVPYTVTGSYTYCGRQGGTGTTCQFGQDPITEQFSATVLGKVTGFSTGTFNGVENSIRFTRVDCQGQTQEGVLINLGSTNILLGYSIGNLVRADGQPDTCGDPPPELPPEEPGWNERNPDVTYVNNDGVDVTVPVGLAFGYINVDVNADLNIPVNVNVGGIDVNLNFDLSTGGISIGPTNNYFGDRRPGSRGSDFLPPPDQDIPDPPPNFPPPAAPLDPEAEELERVIVAAVVTTTSIDTGKVSTFFQEENPDISIPNLGYIQFLCRVGYVDSAWTEDIPVKNRRQVIYCPWPGGAVKVAGTSRPGVEWVITPLYSRKEAPIEFPTSV